MTGGGGAPESTAAAHKPAPPVAPVTPGMTAGSQDKRTLDWPTAWKKAFASFPGAVLLTWLTALILQTLRVVDVYPLLFWLLVAGTLILSFGLTLVTSKYGASLQPKALAASKKLTTETETTYLDRVVQVWVQVISVQMHFNEMLMRTRNYALTLVLAVVGGAAVALEKGAVITMKEWTVGQISLASLLLLLGVAGLLSFYLLDRFYYHPLLVGSVYKGMEIENWAFEFLPAMDLSGVITEHSRKRIGSVKFYARNKLTIFYLTIAILLAISALLVKDVGVSLPETAKVKVVHCELPISDSVVLVSTRGCNATVSGLR